MDHSVNGLMVKVRLPSLVVCEVQQCNISLSVLVLVRLSLWIWIWINITYVY